MGIWKEFSIGLLDIGFILGLLEWFEYMEEVAVVAVSRDFPLIFQDDRSLFVPPYHI